MKKPQVRLSSSDLGRELAEVDAMANDVVLAAAPEIEELARRSGRTILAAALEVVGPGPG